MADNGAQEARHFPWGTMAFTFLSAAVMVGAGVVDSLYHDGKETDLAIISVLGFIGMLGGLLRARRLRNG